MLILAFDTCLDKTYIVLRTEEEIIASEIIESNEKNYHSAYLISTIRDIIKEHGYKPKDINAIGINIGPGSFTGIRACTTVARVMAQQLDCKAVGVSSLEILSRAENDNAVVALDARKNKAYFYDKKLYGAVELEEVDNLLKNRKVITDDRLIERFKPLAKEVVSYQQAGYELGKILSDIVVEKLKTEDGNWAKVLPLYIQPPPVSV
ncbi:MAG: tRNA (adenosine(37)-N6)-threonylcarbamoyltransferase complex dimerization subunit type 1 TsaB [Candidatus Gastranaerophilales bacterium]|nr:tRNA (adenosine(37)-N6)-threonylcarbamoyltransferase complex dimerization subunit type 1 TsaB [Candidatus Gastranaerophilales bacterium]